MLSAVFTAIFPWVCPTCDETLQRPGFCDICSVSLMPLENFCRRCAEPDAIGVCRRCRANPPAFSAMTAAFLYGGHLADAILALKLGKKTYIARSLAREAKQAFEKACDDANIVVPVPLAVHRMAMRGFNQADLLAQYLSAGISIPRKHALVRRGFQAPQMGLSKSERSRNVKNAFRVPKRWRKVIAGKRILLVDDVVSTTATMRAAAEALVAGGASRVFGFCIARAEGRQLK